jgi:hypothetical protein
LLRRYIKFATLSVEDYTQLAVIAAKLYIIVTYFIFFALNPTKLAAII